MTFPAPAFIIIVRKKYTVATDWQQRGNGGMTMKSTGIVRQLDEVGRIVLPIEIRKNFDIKSHDPVEIFVDEEKIILKNKENL